jgi:cell division transport system permease protein
VIRERRQGYLVTTASGKLEQLLEAQKATRLILLLFAFVALLTSFFIISNVVKLNVFARKNEIEILRFVGGTNLFIRIPFWLEGITLGLLGSLLSLGLLFVVINLFPVYLSASLGALQELLRFRYPDLTQSIALLCGGAATGFIGSATSVSKFLKV